MVETEGEGEPRPPLVDASDVRAIDALLARLRAEPRLALDTESDPFHRYFEKVCLLQLASRSDEIIVDPLRGGLAPALVDFLADPSRTMVLHGADYDVRSLRRAFDLVLGRVFDTSLAAMLLGEKELGLKALLDKELGVSIEKTEQRSDWGQRPLRAEQLAYAMADVRHLLPLADRLEDRLAALGRLAWMEEECAALRLKTPTERTFDPGAWRKISGVKALGAVGQKVARALFLWRESEARAEDVPPFRIMANTLIMELAAGVDRGDEVCVVVASRARRLSRHASQRLVGDVIEHGLASHDPIVSPSAPIPDDEHFNHDLLRGRIERMRGVRAERATAIGLDPGFLMSGNVLKRIARNPPASIDALMRIEGMSAWRAEVVGHELLAALCL